MMMWQRRNVLILLNNKVKEIESSQTSKEDKYLANIKYPDTPKDKTGTISDKMSSDGIIPQKGRFNFYLIFIVCLAKKMKGQRV